MTAIRSGKSQKALTATILVTKKVFKNQGVNQGSNFPGPTPKTKVAPQPIFGIFFPARTFRPDFVWLENVWPDLFGLGATLVLGVGPGKLLP